MYGSGDFDPQKNNNGNDFSKLRFMYCAKSLEFIGDCCDATIFRVGQSPLTHYETIRNIAKKLP